MIVDSTNPRIMADNIRELARNGGGGGSDLPDVTAADNGKVLGVVEGSWNKMDAPSGVSHYKVTSGSIEGTFEEVLADLTAGKLVCLDVYVNGSIGGTYFRNGMIGIEETSVTALGFYLIQADKVYDGTLLSDGSFTISKTYPLAIDYSTTEQSTGLKWINGKEIYQKTFENIGSYTDQNQLDTGIPISENIIDVSMSGLATHSGNTYAVTGTNLLISITQGLNNPGVYVFKGSTNYMAYYSGPTMTGDVTIQYTKTPLTKSTKRKTTKGEN